MNDSSRSRRRRERRRAAEARQAQTVAAPPLVPVPAPPLQPPHPAAAARRDRGLGDLAGGGSSQLPPSRAARARDINRPTDEDLAAAERDVKIVRRNWTPS